MRGGQKSRPDGLKRGPGLHVGEAGGRGAHGWGAPGCGWIRGVWGAGREGEGVLGAGIGGGLGPVTSAAPGGEMWMTGCRGLVGGWKWAEGRGDG